MTDDDAARPIPRWFLFFNGGYELAPDGRRVKAKRRFLVDWLSPRGFWHVFAAAYDVAAERWLIYEVNRGGTAIVALTRDQYEKLVAYQIAIGARVLQVDVRTSLRLWLQVGMWCVVACRHLTGARSRALRPIGLWRDLIREGAVEPFSAPADRPVEYV